MQEEERHKLTCLLRQHSVLYSNDASMQLLTAKIKSKKCKKFKVAGKNNVEHDGRNTPRHPDPRAACCTWCCDRNTPVGMLFVHLVCAHQTCDGRNRI